MTIELSKTQSSILEQAALQPDSCVRNFMSNIPQAAQTKVIEALEKKKLIERRVQFQLEEASSKKTIYLITSAGLAAIGKQPEIAANPKKIEPRTSKQSIMLAMLKKGTTIQAIMDVTSWQKHTVHGSMANLKKKLGLTIASDKAESGERIYRIA
jgi:DNA-binding NarL/FixJ family response regulator